MAQLLTWLAGAGARDSAGDPVSSGYAWFFEIGGGTTAAVVYTDVDGTVVATQPVTLDEGGRATVYTIDPVRVVIQDATGADVTDKDQANVTRAEAVQVDSANYSSAYLDGVLAALAESAGGPDGMYMESSGATARTIQEKFSELSVSVKDFGAAGDGLTVDTTAIQAAINRVAFLGGGVVYFPPGTYKLDQQLTVTTSGVSLVGAGQAATILQGPAGLSFSVCDGFTIRDLKIFSTSSVNATGLSLATCTNFSVQGVFVNGFYVAVAMSGCQQATFSGANHFRSPSAAGAAGRSVTLTDTTLASFFGVLCDTFGASSYGAEMLGSTAKVLFTGSAFTSTGTSVRFDAALSGTGFRFTGNSFSIGTAYFSFGAATMPADFYQKGNGIDGYTVDVATGGATVLDLTRGADIRISGITGAGTVTVSNPTVLPAAASFDVRFTTRHVNAAGGAVTWAMGTVFVLDGAVAIPTTDARTVIVDWLWDGTTSKLREVSRSTTVT